MAHTKETEWSGFMPRHEWKKLEEINAILLEACNNLHQLVQDYSMNKTYIPLEHETLRQTRLAIKQTESK